MGRRGQLPAGIVPGHLERLACPLCDAPLWLRTDSDRRVPAYVWDPFVSQRFKGCRGSECVACGYEEAEPEMTQRLRSGHLPLKRRE